MRTSLRTRNSSSALRSRSALPTARRPMWARRSPPLTGSPTDITTPLLITDPDDEQFFPGQPQQLYDLVPGTKELIRFTAHEGANGHCEPMARSLRDTRIFDWLEDYLR